MRQAAGNKQQEPRTLMRVYANLRPKDLADKLAKLET